MGVRVVMYIPPLRSDIAPPYDPNEYANFKVELQNLSQNYDNIIFANLEAIVPSELWGLKKSTTFGSEKLEYDFMHFQEGGHVILAEELIKLIVDDF